MASERVQARIDRLLNEAEEAADRLDWDLVRQKAQGVLAFDPDNQDALAFLAASERASPRSPLQAEPISPQPTAQTQPDSFANGRYTVKRFLGEGGKKKVFLAHDDSLDRDVAFALIKTEGLDAAARERITREAQAMGRLGAHPHIVTVFDIGEEAGQPYLVLPVLGGGDVEGIIEKVPEHKLPIEQAIKIAVETCLGLEFAHGKGIIHRDIKPGNVWLTEDGRAMVGDFGLAVAIDRSRLTQAGMMVGTVNYMPPEQAMGGEITPRSDLYALGAMIYEMVCGRPPFIGDESVAIIGQHLNTPPVAPSWHRPDCPPALEALILRLLEKDPSRRPQSATEVREGLEAVRHSGNRAGDSETARPEPVEGHPSADPLYRRTFVGRENEVRQLQQAFDGAMSGNGGLVMVVGEPGIGKTALCEQLATYVALRGGKALVGHCYEEGSLSLPYLAFVEAMRSYVLARDPDGLRSDLGTGAGEVARIVSEVRDRVQGVELRPAGEPEDDRWRLMQSITTFLRNASTVQPLAIVLEDLHWADRGTLDLLLHVSRNLQGARLLIVGTYRDVEVDRQHPLSSTLGDLRRASNFLRVPLRGLTVDEVHRMYEAIRGNEVPWGQAEAVHRQTEGNPLFVQEVLRYLVEEGIVVRDAGRYVAQGPGEGIPDGLRDVIGRRLSHLDERTNSVLAIASVIGREFRLDVLQEVASLPEEELYSALEQATERAILEQTQTSLAVVFRFTHAMFRTLLYEEIFAPRRIRLHQQVGGALERIYSRRLEEHAAELAEHFSQSTEATDLEKAIQYGELAAQRSVGVYAYGEAVRHLEQALRAQEVLDPDDSLRLCDLTIALGEALLAIADRMRVLEQIAPRALNLAEGLGDSKRAFAACRLALDADFGPLAQAKPESIVWQQKALRNVGDDLAGKVRVYRSMALRNRFLGQAGEAADLLREAITLARALGDPNTFWGVTWAAINEAFLSPSEQEALIDEALSMPRGSISTWNKADFFGVVGIVSLAMGHRGRAEELAVELEELLTRTQHHRARIDHNSLRLWLAMLAGRLHEASQYTMADLVPGTLLVKFTVKLWLGEASVEELMADLGVGAESQTGLLIKAYALAELGRTEEARTIAATAGEMTQSTGRRTVVAYLRTAVLLGDQRGTQDLLKSVDHDVPPMVSVPPLLRDHVLGQAYAMLANTREAHTHYDSALAFAEHLQFRPQIALIRLDVAELLLDHYPDERGAAIEHLDFAIAEFQEMKMQPALERALRHRGLLKA